MEAQGGSAEARTSPERFDEILARLRSLVEKLEGGNLPLEDGLKFFEEGMDLCRRGAEILDRAEKRVEILLSSSGDKPRVAPFESGAESGAKDEAE
jgi:exodeoxyribonuclease VII small subunit